ncbi:MAG: hypothetical protein WCB96_12040 [Candidatus Aminicenantales bacterium]
MPRGFNKRQKPAWQKVRRPLPDWKKSSPNRRPSSLGRRRRGRGAN